jgi:protein gp37
MSKIQWTDKTQNPITVKGGGHYCIKVSPGCANCYAEKMNGRKLAGGDGLKYRVMPYPEMALNRSMLARWARARKPKKIFVGSMTDVAGEWVPDQYIFDLLTAMAEAPKMIFQVLTKRPERMCYMVNQWLMVNGLDKAPDNIWLGTSVENQKCLDDRLIWLIRSQAAVRFLSVEPLLESIVLFDVDGAAAQGMANDNPRGLLYPADMVDWVIVGGESGPGARPLKSDWVVSIINQCSAAGVPVFVKQLGTVWARENGAKDPKGGDPSEWPQHLNRRMFPGP